MRAALADPVAVIDSLVVLEIGVRVDNAQSCIYYVVRSFNSYHDPSATTNDRVLNMESAMKIGYDLLDKVRPCSSRCATFEVERCTFIQGFIPDFLLRLVIRSLCRQRLREIDHGSLEANHAAKLAWIEDVRKRETIAEQTEKANEQHYEVSFGKSTGCRDADRQIL